MPGLTAYGVNPDPNFIGITCEVCTTPLNKGRRKQHLGRGTDKTNYHHDMVLK